MKFAKIAELGKMQLLPANAASYIYTNTAANGTKLNAQGYTEIDAMGGLYSSAVCVSGDGVLGRQRKVHLPPAERFAAGRSMSISRVQ